VWALVKMASHVFFTPELDENFSIAAGKLPGVTLRAVYDYLTEYEQYRLNYSGLL
jgi:hypothetical protein